MRESVLNQFDQQPAKESAGVKLLKRMNELKEKKEKILRKIRETEDVTQKNILKFDLEDIERQINQCPGAIDKYREKKKESDFKNTVGKKNAAEVLDFKREKRAKNDRQAAENELKTEIPDDIKNLVNSEFLAGLERFKKDRGGRPRPRA